MVTSSISASTSDPLVPGVYFVNGEFVEPGEARVSATDLAVLRGIGVFDSLRTYGGRPFMLDAHLARLERSADHAGLSLPWSRKELAEVVHQVVARSPYPETSVRVVVTGGEGANFFTPAGRPSLIVIGSHLKRYPAEYYARGIKVATVELERPLPEAKTTDYLHGQLALQRARRQDPEIVEVLYVDRHGRVTEAITSNVFAFFGDRLVTPGAGMLRGITRELVIDIARDQFQIGEESLYPDALVRANEVFITATVKEIMPVRRIDDTLIGDGAPGANTLRLMAAFRKRVEAFRAGRREPD